MNLPSKQEIKEKYGITEDDFEVLIVSETPSPTQLQSEQSYLEKKGWWKGAEVWIKRLFGGSIKAIIFVGGFISGAEFFQFDNYLIDARDHVVSFAQDLPSHIREEADRYLVALGTESPEDQQRHRELPQQPMMFPTGTIVAPVSGSYIV
jgi:hypothetical protein